MLSVNVTTLPKFADQLSNILGHDFVGRYMVSNTAVRSGTRHQIAQQERRLHPLYHYWSALQADIEQTKQKKQLILSPNSRFALHLLSNLVDIQSLDNSNRILEDIRNPTTFASGVFEAAIAAGYVAIKAPLEICAESNKKSPDFRISTARDTTLSIECKSLQNKEAEEHHLWKQLFAATLNRLQKRKRSWQIGFFSDREITGKEIKLLTDAVFQAIDHDQLGCASIEAGLGFEVVQLSVWGQSIGNQVQIRNVEADLIEIEGLFQPTNTEHVWRCPIAVFVMQHHPTSETKRIISAIKDASSQLAVGGPNCVHIEVPYRDGARLLKIADDAFQAIQNQLQRNHSRITYVVLSGWYSDSHPRNGHDPYTPTHVVIPNPSANVRTRPLRILGDAPHPAFKLSETGTIAFELEIFEQLARQPGRSLLYKTSVDSTQQLRVWETFSNKLRVDVVAPPGARRSIEFPNPELAINRIYKFAARWTADAIDVWIDGKCVHRVGEFPQSDESAGEVPDRSLAELKASASVFLSNPN